MRATLQFPNSISITILTWQGSQELPKTTTPDCLPRVAHFTAGLKFCASAHFMVLSISDSATQQSVLSIILTFPQVNTFHLHFAFYWWFSDGHFIGMERYQEILHEVRIFQLWKTEWTWIKNISFSPIRENQFQSLFIWERFSCSLLAWYLHVSQICEIFKKGKRKVVFSPRIHACISSWEAHTQQGEESTSHKFTIQIFKRQQGEASLRRTQWPIPTDSEGLSSGWQWAPQYRAWGRRRMAGVPASFLSEKVKIFFSVLGHYDSWFLIFCVLIS